MKTKLIHENTRLGEDQLRALRILSGRRGHIDPTQIGEGVPIDLQHRAQLWSGLARRGLLSTFRNSAQVRGERRAYWIEYALTDKGRALLDQMYGPYL